jgi:hypothetical protein
MSGGWNTSKLLSCALPRAPPRRAKPLTDKSQLSPMRYVNHRLVTQRLARRITADAEDGEKLTSGTFRASSPTCSTTSV